MPEPVEFPVPADDLRFLERSKRSRSPPRPSPGRDPPEQSPASVAAGKLLRRYMYRSWPRPKRRVKKRRLPKQVVAGVCFVFAVTLIPIELIYFIACRPDLSGRAVRARLITPRDLLPVALLRSRPATVLLKPLRM